MFTSTAPRVVHDAQRSPLHFGPIDQMPKLDSWFKVDESSPGDGYRPLCFAVAEVGAVSFWSAPIG